MSRSPLMGSSRFRRRSFQMNAYLARVIENVKAKHADEPEFIQTVEEVLTSL